MAVASVSLNSARVACVCFPVGLQPTCLASGRLKFCFIGYKSSHACES